MAHYTRDWSRLYRRFLQHVLPKGLHKVRYYGLWHSTPCEHAAQTRHLLLLQRRERSQMPPIVLTTRRSPPNRSSVRTATIAEYIERARLTEAERVPLFQAISYRAYGRGETVLNGERLHRANAWATARQGGRHHHRSVQPHFPGDLP